MPKNSKGEKRPADMNKLAAFIVGEATSERPKEDKTISDNKRKAGVAGAQARKDKLTKQQRSDIARKGARARWKHD